MILMTSFDNALDLLEKIIRGIDWPRCHQHPNHTPATNSIICKSCPQINGCPILLRCNATNRRLREGIALLRNIKIEK